MLRNQTIDAVVVEKTKENEGPKMRKISKPKKVKKGVQLELLQSLKTGRARLENIYIDVNNNRKPFHDEELTVDEMLDKKLQLKERNALLKGHAKQIYESIRVSGYIATDRIVLVRAKPDSDCYFVAEGSGRVAAMKEAIEKAVLHNIPPEILASIEEIDVMIIEGYYETTRHLQQAAQGIRHISGIKDWKPLAKAKYLYTSVVEDGHDIGGLANSLGLGTNTMVWMLNGYYAYMSMYNNDEVTLPETEEDRAALFNHFVEALKSPEVRAEYGWDNIKKDFDQTKVLGMYALMGLYDPDTNIKCIHKAVDFRDLGKILKDEAAKREFYATLSIAKGIEIMKKPVEDKDTPMTAKLAKSEWSEKLKVIDETFQEIPLKFIKSLNIVDIQTLESIKKTIDELIGGETIE